MNAELMVWLNGRLVPRYQAMVSAFDRGLLYGYGLFETMRSYGGVVFRLERHRQRLLEGAYTLGIGAEAELLPFRDAVYATVDANGLREARIRVTVTGGPGPRELGPATDGLTMLVEAVQLEEPPRESYEQGIPVIIAMKARRDSGSPASYLKSTNWIPGLLAQDEARRTGAEEALLLNQEGSLAEGTASNIFCVKDGVLHTPSIATGILGGTTREVVLELALELGIPRAERLVLPTELLAADEAFITSAIRLIMPMRSVDGQPIGQGRSGEVTKRLMQAYRELVMRETAVGRG